MNRLFWGLLSLMIIFIVCSSIFALKVRLLENDVKKLSYRINEDSHVLQNLKAEWNYLNNPNYLKPMAKKYLNHMVNNNRVDPDLVFKIPLKPNLYEN